MKTRFDGLDVTAMAAVVQRCVGRRVINIYDGLSGDSYVIKLDGESKAYLVLESGIRFHPLSHYTSEQPAPSGFCAKLRKHLRGLRLEQVVQLGQDRVVLWQFGMGASKHYVILELYAKGNLLLTDASYTILALLRTHMYADQQVAVKVGQVYPVTYATSLEVKKDGSDGGEGMTVEVLRDYFEKQLATSSAESSTSPAAVAAAAEKSNNGDSKAAGEGMDEGNTVADGDYDADSDADEANNESKVEAPAESSTNTSSNNNQKGTQKAGKNKVQNKNGTKNATQSKKGKKAVVHTLKSVLLQPNLGFFHYGPALIEHCILHAGLSPNKTLTADSLQDIDWQALLTSLQQEGSSVLAALQQATTKDCPGYILYKPKDKTSEVVDTATTTELKHADKILEEFQPHLLKQHQDCLYLEYANFGEAVEDFFRHIVTQKRLIKAQAAESAVQDRLDKVRSNQMDRVKKNKRYCMRTPRRLSGMLRMWTRLCWW
jgi:predicted ribosome quality control (RQC) complex YloA/Tae2 family protein